MFATGAVRFEHSIWISCIASVTILGYNEHMEVQTSAQQPSTTPQQEPERRGINWGFQLQQYGAAVMVAALPFVALSVYLFFRRGYYDLYIINKLFAGVGAILLGLVLLLGPLSRFFDRFDRYAQYSKELGIVAFFLIIAHAVSSYYFLPTHFARERFYTTGFFPFIYGLAATVLLVLLFAISNQIAMKALGARRWWLMQSWSVRIIFVLVALHVGVMKMQGWASWYQKGGGPELVHPEWPGAGLLVGWFVAFVILIRLAEVAGQKFGKLVWYCGVVALLAIYIFTFWWGQRFI